MLKINTTYAMRLRVPKGTVAPKPFPGRYPTRIAAQWYEHAKGAKPILHSYVGKPSGDLARLFCAYSENFVRFVEFDRANKLVQYWLDEKNLNYKTIMSRHLFTLYHPGATTPESTSPMDNFLLKHFWLDSLAHPRQTLNKKFTFYVAPAQRGEARALEAIVMSLLEGTSAETLARREHEKELLKIKRAKMYSEHGYKSRFYGGGF
jgi:hypothetical protein